MPTPNAASPEEATNNSIGAETTRNSISAGEISTTQDSVSTETIPSTTIPVPHFSQIPSSHTPLSSSALAVNLDRESIAVNLTLIDQDTVTNAAIGGSDEVANGSPRLLSQSDLTAPPLHAQTTRPSNSHPDSTPPQSTPVQQHQINSLAYYFLINWNFAALRFSSSTVHVILDDGTVFIAETEMLQHTSIYFSGLFRHAKSWLESRSGVVRLEDVEANAFAVYQLWLNTGSIDNNSTAIQQQGPSKLAGMAGGVPPDEYVAASNKLDIIKTSIDDKVDLLTQCYLLGGYIGAPGFQNDVIDEISRLYSDFYYADSRIPLYNIGYICDKTTSNNPLRRFVVDALHCGLSRKTLTEAAEMNLIPLDVAIAVAGNAIEDRDAPWKTPRRCLPWDANPCHYHVHPRGDFNSPCSDPCSSNDIENCKWDIMPWQQDYVGIDDWW